MVLNLDLNSPPCEGTSASIDPQVASAESSDGLFGSPIDVEEIEDEVELLSSSTAFPQWRNNPRKRNRRITVDLERTMQMPLSQSVDMVEPAAILLSFSGHGNHERTSTHRNNFNQQVYFDLEEYDKTKWQRDYPGSSSRTAPEPQAVAPKATQPPSPPPPPPKEPTFSCPLCMDSLTCPCSTFCGHIFCQACIEVCIAASVKKKAGKQCPTCRAKLPAKKSFHRVYLPTRI